MKWARAIAVGVLLLTAVVSIAANFIAPAGYAHQFRTEPAARPSKQHLLGTDDLGRDRLSRVIYGTRVSLILAPAAALVATALAALIGGTAGFAGGWIESAMMAVTDLFLSLPWFFLLITVRALVPLNVPAMASVGITFVLLGCLGWAASARVVCSDVRAMRNSDFILLARAGGSGRWRLLMRHIVPNLRPLLLAQFWISIPTFILAEANLGMLGLGVAEPLPSWGSLLRELQGAALAAHAWQFAPLVLFVAIVSCFHLVLTKEELPS
ncbi:MAG TPA: ABC transporter permease [Terriglobales bacterium]|nr:ABC transporter permease [Terriglobales bacterium]